MHLQMGLSKRLTDRKPQRYQVQNQTGMMLWYWAGTDSPGPSTSSAESSGRPLPPGSFPYKLKPNTSEHLRSVSLSCSSADVHRS